MVDPCVHTPPQFPLNSWWFIPHIGSLLIRIYNHRITNRCSTTTCVRCTFSVGFKNYEPDHVLKPSPEWASPVPPSWIKPGSNGMASHFLSKWIYTVHISFCRCKHRYMFMCKMSYNLNIKNAAGIFHGFWMAELSLAQWRLGWCRTLFSILKHGHRGEQ